MCAWFRYSLINAYLIALIEMWCRDMKCVYASHIAIQHGFSKSGKRVLCWDDLGFFFCYFFLSFPFTRFSLHFFLDATHILNGYSFLCTFSLESLRFRMWHVRNVAVQFVALLSHLVDWLFDWLCSFRSERKCGFRSLFLLLRLFLSRFHFYSILLFVQRIAFNIFLIDKFPFEGSMLRAFIVERLNTFSWCAIKW